MVSGPLTDAACRTVASSLTLIVLCFSTRASSTNRAMPRAPSACARSTTQLPVADRNCSTTTLPGWANCVLTTSTSRIPRALRCRWSMTGGLTVTRTTGLLARSGPVSRKAALVTSAGTWIVTFPAEVVVPDPATLHFAVPAARSSRVTLAPDTAVPDLVSLPSMAALCPATMLPAVGTAVSTSADAAGLGEADPDGWRLGAAEPDGAGVGWPGAGCPEEVR